MNSILPNIFYFNPTCEYAIANGDAAWNPNRILQKMESDLALLPLFLAQSGDYIIVDKIPSSAFINSLNQLNLDTPKFILKKDALNNASFIKLQKNKLLPWGWSPAAHKLLSPLKASCSSEFQNSPVFNWRPEYRNLYSKKFAAGILKTLVHEYPSEHFIAKKQLTEVCTSKHDFEKLIQKWGKLMVKAPLSSSGRGLQPITKTPIHPKVWDKLLAIVKDQNYAIVEPYLNKALDLAFQFELKNEKIRFLGFSNFTTDYKGQYNSNSLNGLPDNLDNKILEFAKYIPTKIIPPLIQILEKSDLAKYYEGNFGVDTLIYYNEKNELKINPCLEINVRQSMGLLSIQYEKLIHLEKKGVYKTYYQPGSTFLQFKNKMENKNPLKIVNGKIISGFFPLIEASEKTLFGAYILV